MSNKYLDRFGEVLMRGVRDHAIVDWDMIPDGEMKGSRARIIQQALVNLTEEKLELLRWINPQVVDTTIHHLL